VGKRKEAEATDESPIIRREAQALKRAITALRSEVRKERLERERTVMTAVASTQEEIARLQERISALGDDLEQLRIDQEKASSSAPVIGNGPVLWMHDAVSGTPDQTEMAKRSCEARLRESERSIRSQIVQCNETIQTLRGLLDRGAAAAE
jgi:hypothetical protein